MCSRAQNLSRGEAVMVRMLCKRIGVGFRVEGLGGELALTFPAGVL